MIQLKKELKGKILDIGGGGEGVVGRLYREQVIAIDHCQEELDEAPDGYKKILMDAADLQFSDAAFNNVTFFFSLMYMDSQTQRWAIEEAVRVLKNNGEIHIWDCNILSAYPVPFCIDVEISLPSEHIFTTYGVGKLDTQDRNSIIQMCLNAGLVLLEEYKEDETSFYLRFKKNMSVGK